MSTSTRKKERKPVFGPPVSPEISALKWRHKFDELHLIGEALSSSGDRRSMDSFNNWLTREVDYADNLLAAVLWTHHEADEIGLAIKLFAYISGNLDGSKLYLNGLVEKFQQAKNGNLLYRFAKWHEVPLSLRRRINDFLAAMDEMKGSGNGKMIADREILGRGLEKTGASMELIERMERLYSG